MIIQDGIVYAGEIMPMLKVTGVRPLPNHQLWLSFNNGEVKIFDFNPMLDQPAFMPLKDSELFKSVYLDYGVPVWQNGDIDIAPEYLLEHSRMIGTTDGGE